MSCKILSDGMFSFVCLPSGRKVPLQTDIIISQDHNMPGRAKVVFRAISDSRVSGLKIESRGGNLWVGDDEVAGVLSFSVIPADNRYDNEKIEATLMCDLVATTAAPHPARTYLHYERKEA